MIPNRVRRLTRPQLVLPLASLLVGGSLMLNLSTDTSQAVPQQSAAPTCTLNVPAKYAISSPYYEVPVTRGADCAAAGVIDAQWDAKRADGALMYQLMFRWDYPETWNVFDNDSLAPWTWYPAGATTGDITLATNSKSAATPTPESSSSNQAATTVPQNTPTTDIRMASGGRLYWVPADPDPYTHTYAFYVDASRYAITPADFINYGGAKGSLQKRAEGASGWTVLASFTLDSAGHFGIVLPAPTVKTYYRVALYDAQYIFGSLLGGNDWINP
jgi:hypothetical protein